MRILTLVGIGSGNPDLLTRSAIRALNNAELILIPRKHGEKSELAEIRRMICDEILESPQPSLVEFYLPIRRSDTDYLDTVDAWHDEIANVWSDAVASRPKNVERVALLIWGDPSLFDSSLRIARRLQPAPEIEVIPGITSIQALCAAHKIPLNDIGEPFVVTTGRQLRDKGWPEATNTVVVMLDAGGSFNAVLQEELYIWWGAYLGMPGELLVSGPLADVADQIANVRRLARQQRGWIMDTYILKRA